MRAVLNHSAEYHWGKTVDFGAGNCELMRQHLSVLAGQVNIESLQFIFSAFHDRDKTARPWQQLGTLRQVMPDLIRQQIDGYGIFVTVNCSRNGRRRAADINRVRACWIDLDQPMRGAFALTPSLKIQTGAGKGHAYWVVNEADPFSVHECEPINRAIAIQHGGDLNACDRSRVLRLAGTYHLKRTPFLVRITDATGMQYGRKQIFDAYPQPPIAERRVVGFDFSVSHSDRYIAAAIDGERQMLASAIEGNRNPALNRAAFCLGQLDLGLEQIARVLGPVALDIGLSRKEAWDTIRSGAGAGARIPRGPGGSDHART